MASKSAAPIRCYTHAKKVIGYRALPGCLTEGKQVGGVVLLPGTEVTKPRYLEWWCASRGAGGGGFAGAVRQLREASHFTVVVSSSPSKLLWGVAETDCVRLHQNRLRVGCSWTTAAFMSKVHMCALCMQSFVWDMLNHTR
jgi:hypothetical protein